MDLSQLVLIRGVDLTLDLSGAVRPREVPIAAKLASGGTAKATAERGRHTHEQAQLRVFGCEYFPMRSQGPVVPFKHEVIIATVIRDCDCVESGVQGSAARQFLCHIKTFSTETSNSITGGPVAT